MRADVILFNEFPPPRVIANWAEWMGEGKDESNVERIPRQTTTGRPCRSAQFLAEFERLMDRVLAPRKPGRKPKTPPDPEARQDDKAGNS